MTEVSIVGLTLFWLAWGFVMAIMGFFLYHMTAVCGVIWVLIWAVILTYGFIDALRRDRRGRINGKRGL
jgi:energy-converting hydrogenase Eha subunit E